MTVAFRFTKGSGKQDSMTVLRNGVADRSIDSPKQRIIPHDMVHFAVEDVLGARGFLARVAHGDSADYRFGADPETDGVERLVEVMQGDGWSGGTTPAAEMIDLYRVTCAARACPMLPVDAATIDAIRERMIALSRQWEEVPTGGTLTLTFSNQRVGTGSGPE